MRDILQSYSLTGSLYKPPHFHGTSPHSHCSCTWCQAQTISQCLKTGSWTWQKCHHQASWVRCPSPDTERGSKKKVNVPIKIFKILIFKCHQAHPSLKTRSETQSHCIQKWGENQFHTKPCSPYCLSMGHSCATKEHFSDTEGRSCEQPVAVSPTLGEKVQVWGFLGSHVALTVWMLLST